MSELFTAKIRKVGTSLGVLIPKEIVKEEKLREGQKIELSLLKRRRIEEVLKLFGTAKGAMPFERDRIDRLERC